jgi:predicted dithiol-disulfide oxidoreductase (DUF899 family)
MAENNTLTPATELAKKNTATYPNESAAYREARNALLAEEIELRRAVERVAALRRELPPGGVVPKDYHFIGENGPVTLSQMFGDKQTLIVYSYMFGPQRQKPCPMCTSLMRSWEGNAPNVEARIALAMVARSPIERLIETKKALGWKNLKVFSDSDGEYTRTYVSPEDADVPAYNVFTRRDGTIRHFWSDEISGEMADPGQDPRGAPDPDSLWHLLDRTPEGRGTDWYPKLML